jgi:hypothetical protein
VARFVRSRTSKTTRALWATLLGAVALSVLTVASAHADSTRSSASAGAEPPVVASLTPAATARLWRRLVATRSLRARAPQQADCRALRGIFYAPTDYLRLATKLAASASPCAQYYVTIPPIVADKTQPRRDAAWRVRALGPNFHAMAEFHFTTWNRWVASTGSSWYQAGVTARERMASAGYDFANGDSWVVNELSTAVRRGTGNARANIRELLRGLYEGDGSRPTRGAVFIVGVGQRSTDVSLYQTNLQNWFADAAFWADMATYVSDWSQEVYGDVRSYAVPGVPAETRRDYLNDYLQHKLVLADAGPPTIETARSFLGSTFSPLANAAWEREAGYGWTMVPVEQMAGYVSAQVQALRYFSSANAQTQDHWGFAWAPRNGGGMSASEFAARTDLILDRLGAAVRDSAQTPDPENPGSGACGPPGQNLWCLGDLDGARLNEAWKAFRGWTQSALSFTTPAQTLRAGSPSAAMNLSLVTSSGLGVTTTTPLTVTLSSSSRQGTFSTSPSGPWTPTLSLTIAAGAGTTGAFYYQDTRAGSPVLSAVTGGATTGTQTVTVNPGPAVEVNLKPASATVQARATARFTASGVDAYGNAFAVSASWSVRPQALGVISPRSGNAATFTARRVLGTAIVTASVATEIGAISAGAQVRVEPGRLRIGSIAYRKLKGVLLVTTSAVDAAGAPVSATTVSVLVKRDGRRHLTARGTTGASGRIVYRVPARREGCFTTVIRKVTAAGFVWDGRTPRNRICT